jgi:hypothetical protein
MPDIRLPLTASAAEIADAIRQVQARCRLGLCQDPDALAAEVRAQLDAGERAAAALGVGLAELFPSLEAWERRPSGRACFGGDDTVVSVSRNGLRVHRGGNPAVSRCALELTIYLAGESHRW